MTHTFMAKEILNNLRKLNRKERYYLVGMALGNESFKLSKQFRKKVGMEFGLEIPENAFAAMDYHLDWLFASIILSTNPNTQNKYSIEKQGSKIIKGTQEDIDFLIAYEDGDICRIIMLEAKGVTSYSTKQMESKRERLAHFFGQVVNSPTIIVPYFAVVSPNRPRGIAAHKWPEWAKNNNELQWIELTHLKNIRHELQKITRFDEKSEKPEKYRYWKLGKS